MLGRREGFSLIELIVVMTVVMFVLAAASKFLTSMLTQFKQQTKIAEAGIESAVGLQVLRRDILSAGYGLPTAGLPSSYSEANTGINAAKYNDSPSAPRAVIATNPAFATHNDSDYLVIKSVSVSENPAAGVWQYLGYDNKKIERTPAAGNENLLSSDYVMVISVGVDAKKKRVMELVNDSTGKWVTQYNDTAEFVPDREEKKHVIYGLDSTSEPKFPFNRADYFIVSKDNDPAANIVPENCAEGTGVLVKAVLSHADGKTIDLNADKIPDYMRLLDCVATIQVAVRLGDGATANSTDGMTARDIRQKVREVRVYVLAHEGQKDPGYIFSENSKVWVGETGLGAEFDLSGIDQWKHYRWKVYTVTGKTYNLVETEG